MSASGEIDEAWHGFEAARRDADLDVIITEEGLRPEGTRKFVETAFRNGVIQSASSAITKVLPPCPPFS